MKVEQLMAKVYDPRRLYAAWQRVKSNAGAAGIDQMTVEDFARRESELLTRIHDKLMSGRYRFQPARRVLIPKPGTSKTRKLGIPVVMDRIVGLSMHAVLEGIFDPEFTESNFGYRRRKSQHQAIRHLQSHVKAGKEWAVAVDLKAFFDEIPHNLILKLIHRKVADEGFITLVARVLKAGVMIDGKLVKTTKGCPQGSPLSPILSNIVLNEMDQQLEDRHLSYCRWADDFVIMVKTERAAQRVMQGTVRFLEEELGLEVNREKSRVAPIKEITFLGFVILRGKILASLQAQDRFKTKIRELTRRNNPLSMYQVVYQLNQYLRGWVGYFRIHQFLSLFKHLDSWIRNRLRSMQLKKWKKPKKFQRMMINAGCDPRKALNTWVRMDRWASVSRREVKTTMSLDWFRHLGLVFLHDYTSSFPRVRR
jgi:group II intron reverse transcriptase/maturase